MKNKNKNSQHFFCVQKQEVRIRKKEKKEILSIMHSEMNRYHQHPTRSDPIKQMNFYFLLTIALTANTTARKSLPAKKKISHSVTMRKIKCIHFDQKNQLLEIA